MDINKYRNYINNLINWELKILKQLRKKRRKNIFLRGSFAKTNLISILFCVFAPPHIINRLLIAIGFPDSLITWIRIICFFVQLWFISPLDKLSKKEKEEEEKNKINEVKAVEKAREV